MASEVSAQKPFYYVVVVWGDKYVDMLLDMAMPTFLSPKNLPALTNLAESRFVILTTTADQARIEAAPIFRKLKTVIEPLFIPLPDAPAGGTQQLRAAWAHRAAAELAARNHGFCIYLCPDCLLADGSLSYLETAARKGTKAILIPGLRLVRETVQSELAQNSLRAKDAPLTLPPRDLVAFGLRHLHREVQRYNWDHSDFALFPHLCTWSVPGERGLLIRAFHLHPIMVSMEDAADLSALDTSTIDGDFIGYSITDWDLIHVETDSDNIVIFSLTDMNDRIEPLPSKGDQRERLRAIATSKLVTPLHRYYFSRAIKMHCDDLNEKWNRLERETGHLMYEVLKLDPIDPRAHLPFIAARFLFGELRHRVKSRLSRSLRGLRGR